MALAIARRLSTLSLFFLVFVLGCDGDDIPAISVRLQPAEAPNPSAPAAEEPGARFVVGAIFSPERSFAAWGSFVAYLGEKLGRSLRMVHRRTYAEANALLETGEAWAGIVCSGAYVAGRDEFGLIPLAVPLMREGLEYRSYIIVPAESPARSLDELRGKSFALSDPLSNTGCYYVAYLLARKGATLQAFFGRTLYTYGHDSSIEAVANGLVDGAAVDGLVYDALRAKEPALIERTRVIARSEPFAVQPIVASPAAPPGFRERLLRILLACHETPQGRAVLAGLDVERFVPADDGAYAEVRAMRAAVRRPADGGAR